MPLTVVSLCTYLTRVDRGWRDGDYVAYKFIKALKGESFNGYADFPVRGNWIRLTAGARAQALTCFARLAADYLVANENLSGPVYLVPLPSSDAVVNTTFTRFPARDLVQALVAELARLRAPVAMADLLRWKTARTPSHAGGSRDAYKHYENLTVIAKPQEATHVLVDDVFTTGGHLRAAKRRLEEAGAYVSRALCAGRTVQEQLDKPLSFRTEELEDLGDPSDEGDVWF